MAIACLSVRVEVYAAQVSQYSITVDATATEGEVSPTLFGSNIEWTRGESILRDKSRPEVGFRSDVLALARGLGVSVMRFPGGNLSEIYRWRDGVGPLERRREINYSGEKLCVPYFGTDEFMALCEEMGCAEKMITVNYCTGTPQEAANWVEYCNAPAPESPDPSWTVQSYGGGGKAPKGYFAWLRSKFGHPEPYGVRYWEIGNEVYCRDDLEARLMPGQGIEPVEYGRSVVKYSAAMKAVDPSIKIGAVVVDESRFGDWTEDVLREAAGSVDFVSPHYYSGLRALSFDTVFRSTRRDGSGSSVRRVRFPLAGEHTFRITARAELASGQPTVPAEMELCIDGEPVRVFAVGVLPSEYEYTCKLTAGYHEVSIGLGNSYSNSASGGRRSLLIYGVTRQSGSAREQSIWYPADAEQQVLFDDGRVIGERIRKLQAQIQKYSPDRKLEIAVTEGGLNYPYEGSVKWAGYPTEEVRHALRYKSALWLSGLLNSLIREQVSAYCHWNLLDVGHYGVIRDPAFTSAGSVRAAPTYHVLQMYSSLGGADVLGAEVVSRAFRYPASLPVPPVRHGSDYSRSLPRPKAVPYLDVVACRSGDGETLFVMAANRYLGAAQTEIRVRGFPVGQTGLARTLSVRSLEPRAGRVVGDGETALEAHSETLTLARHRIKPDDIGVDRVEIEGVCEEFEYIFPPHSLTLLELRRDER